MRGPLLPFILLPLSMASACTRPGGPYPSLAPRPAEAIDPRVPVTKMANDRPAAATLLARLNALIAEARSGDVQFAPALANAERLATAAGPARSEGWILAQQALSAAIAARAPTARAMGDIDALAATLIKSQGGIAPNDLKAIEEAANVIRAIDQRQSGAVRSIQRRLGN